MTTTATATAKLNLGYGRGYTGKMGNRCWVAHISGRDPKYKFRREFIEPEKITKAHFNRYRTMIQYAYDLSVDCLYEVSEAGDRWFVAVYRHKDTGEPCIARVTEARATAWAAALDEGKTDREARLTSKGL